MKITNLLVAVAIASAAMMGSVAHAQTYTPGQAPPPPGMNDPGVQATAPAASSAAPAPAATPKPDLHPLTLPAMKSGDSRMGRPASEPTVEIRQQGENTVQEYSRNGRVYMVVVTPKHGLQRTYMVDPQGRLVDEHGQRRATPALYKVLEWGKSRPPAAESDAPASSSSR